MLETLRRWKFGGDPCLRRGMGDLAVEALHRFWPREHFDAVVPVPCHAATLRRRGFDLPAFLSRGVAGAAGVPWRPLALQKAQAIPELVGLDVRQRVAAVRSAYRPRQGLEGSVLLVDDVVTSTVTARACARACQEAGAGQVRVLSLVRTPLEGAGRGGFAGGW
ncbi:MAG: ComF family protein [Deferrisomatales bacterium]